MNKVIIIGGFHHNTYGLIRSLGETGLKSDVILEPSHIRVNWLFASKYIKKAHILSDGENLVDYLLTTYSDEEEKPVVYCGSDNSISLLDNAYNLLKEKFFIFNADGKQGRINYFMNKESMFPLAEKCGLTTIKTWHLKRNEIEKANLHYPILVKPSNSLGGVKTDIKVSYNQKELLENMHDGVDYILQEYIDKDYELNMLGLSLKTGNSIFYPGVIKKLREYPIKKGSSSFARIDALNEYPIFNIDGIKKFVHMIGYEGLFSIEFVVKGNTCYFLEINMRNDGNGYMSTGAGLNLPLIWYRYCCGIADNSHSLHLEKPFYFMSEETDYKQVTTGHLSISKWIKSLFMTDAFFIINKKDIKPGLMFLALEFVRMIKHFIKKISNIPILQDI